MYKTDGEIQNMNTTTHIDGFFKSFTETVPKSLFSFHKDLEKNLRVALDAALRKMNLVTREEFELQSALLERTLVRLETLEAQMAQHSSNQSNQIEE